MPEQITAVVSLIVSFVFVSILLRLRVESAIDEFRENMFSLREEMFLYAAREGLLNDPAYTKLRDIMNGFIRFGHRLSLSYWLSRVVAAKCAGFDSPRTDVLEQWDVAMSALPLSHSREFRNFHSVQMLLVLHYIITRSLFGSFMFSVISLCGKSTKPRLIEQDMLNAIGQDSFTILEGDAVCYVN